MICIQYIYSYTIFDEQVQKINTKVDSSLKALYQQKSNTIKDVQNREPSNKNVDKELKFYSTIKPRTKAPKEQKLNKPTI